MCKVVSVLCSCNGRKNRPTVFSLNHSSNLRLILDCHEVVIKSVVTYIIELQFIHEVAVFVFNLASFYKQLSKLVFNIRKIFDEAEKIWKTCNMETMFWPMLKVPIHNRSLIELVPLQLKQLVTGSPTHPVIDAKSAPCVAGTNLQNVGYLSVW